VDALVLFAEQLCTGVSLTSASTATAASWRFATLVLISPVLVAFFFVFCVGGVFLHFFVFIYGGWWMEE
jgi:hypothetical protein